MRRLVFGMLALIPFCLASCGGGATHESLAKQSMTAMESLVKSLEGVKDKASWDAAKPALDKALATLEGIGKQVKALPKADEATEKKLQESVGAQMADVSKRMMAAGMKLAGIKDIAEDVQKFMGEMGKRMADMK